MADPYYDDGTVQLWLGDCREVLPALGLTADLIVADPPYGETSLAWDRWPDGWLDVAATVSSSLWCFGSMRMFLEQRDEFASWKLSQDVIWQKTNGTGPGTDRFKRVHEIVTHWYRGPWGSIHHDVPKVPATWEQIHRNGKSAKQRDGGRRHLGEFGPSEWRENGERFMRSVITVRNMRGRAIHPTEKPVPLLSHLITYGCPDGGLVVDPFAGSGSTLVAARNLGRRAIGIEAHEPYIERAARRLAQAPLEVTGG